MSQIFQFEDNEYVFHDLPIVKLLAICTLAKTIGKNKAGEIMTDTSVILSNIRSYKPDTKFRIDKLSRDTINVSIDIIKMHIEDEIDDIEERNEIPSMRISTGIYTSMDNDDN